MPIDDRTTNRSYQLPNFANLLADDVTRLRAALQSIDADIFARYTKAEVDTLLTGLIQGAPGALDTLNELAAALGDDPNFAATITNQLAQKANSADVYTRTQSDARYVQGQTQAEMVFIATANQSVFTLSTPVINKPSALVTVDGVVQPTSEYSLNQAGTSLTLSEGVPVGTVVRVLALGVASAGAPADDSVTEPKFRTGAVSTRALAVGIAPTVGSINAGPLAGFRNAIINGHFWLWQRGTSFTGSEYGADRWRNLRNGTACTMSRQKFSLGQTQVPGDPEFFCRMVVASVTGADNYSLLQQRIEYVRTFASKEITISFWARANAPGSISIELEQIFGTGGSPSAPVTGIGVVKKQVTTSWQKIEHTVTLPSLSGKTQGADDDCLALNIWLDAGSNFASRTAELGHQSNTFSISQVQVELGPISTPFERRPEAVEFVLCQRYYQAGTRVNVGGVTANGVGLYSSVQLPVRMRRTPAAEQESVAFVGSCNDISVLPGTGHMDVIVSNTTGGAGIASAFYALSAEL
jgi:hypothetical protein